jgi:hypothetical protein
VAQGATAGRAGIHPWLKAGDSVVADVIVDGKVVSRLEHRAVVEGLTKPPALVFPLPAGPKRLRLRGHATLQGVAAPFDRTWKVHDLAPHSAPLYDQGKPLVERIRGLAARLEGAFTIQPGDGGARKKPAKLAFADLEKSLGAALPAQVKVLGDWQIKVDHSSFVSAADMRSVTAMLLAEWGYKPTGELGLDGMLSPAVRARYDRSVGVFLEVGDGLGTLAWDPAGVTAGEPPNTSNDKGNPGARPGPAGDGVWYWVHQEHLNDPVLLLDDDYRPRTAEAALTHVFQRFVLSAGEQPETDDGLVLDTANPRANLLQLSFDGPSRPRLRLRSYDHHYSMY